MCGTMTASNNLKHPLERETTNISRRKLGAEAARQPEQSSELKRTTKSPNDLRMCMVNLFCLVL